jgi:hypothetical protein
MVTTITFASLAHLEAQHKAITCVQEVSQCAGNPEKFFGMQVVMDLYWRALMKAESQASTTVKIEIPCDNKKAKELLASINGLIFEFVAKGIVAPKNDLLKLLTENSAMLSEELPTAVGLH